jgi:hypothetical protein
MMLAELKSAHDDVLRAIDALAEEVARPEPGQMLPAARLALSKASGRRRSLLQCTILPALHDLDPVSGRAVDALRRAMADDLVASSDHVRRWTLTQVQADWLGYRKASDATRAHMRQRIEAEAALLYPLLEAHTARAA